MAPPVQSYLWTRVQTAVGLWVESVTGFPASAPAGVPVTPARVVWSTYDLAQVPKPFASLQRLTATSAGEPSVYGPVERAVQQTITVTAALAGEAVRLWLLFAEVVVIVQPLASLSDTRGQLLAVLQSQVEPLNYAASGLASIVVTPKGTQIVNVTPLIGCTVADNVTEFVEVRATARRYRIRIQLYSDVGDGDESIDEYADALLVSLRTPRTLTFLQNYGVAVEGAPEVATDISSISGPLQERRLFFDVTFTATSASYIRDVDGIDEIAPPVVDLIEA